MNHLQRVPGFKEFRGRRTSTARSGRLLSSVGGAAGTAPRAGLCKEADATGAASAGDIEDTPAEARGCSALRSAVRRTWALISATGRRMSTRRLWIIFSVFTVSLSSMSAERLRRGRDGGAIGGAVGTASSMAINPVADGLSNGCGASDLA